MNTEPMENKVSKEVESCSVAHSGVWCYNFLNQCIQKKGLCDNSFYSGVVILGRDGRFVLVVPMVNISHMFQLRCG